MGKRPNSPCVSYGIKGDTEILHGMQLRAESTGRECKDRSSNVSEMKGGDGNGGVLTIAVLVEEAEGFLELGDLVVGELVRHGLDALTLLSSGARVACRRDQARGWGEGSATGGRERFEGRSVLGPGQFRRVLYIRASAPSPPPFPR
jgi:hypothetical protein